MISNTKQLYIQNEKSSKLKNFFSSPNIDSDLQKFSDYNPVKNMDVNIAHIMRSNEQIARILKRILAQLMLDSNINTQLEDHDPSSVE